MNSRGLTLIEVIITAGIGAFAISALLFFLARGFPLQRQIFLQANASETARVQLQRIARQMREVRPSGAGAYPLVAMEPQSIVFYADVDSDDQVERVRYTLNGTNLERGTIEPTGDPITYNEANESVRIVARSIQNAETDVFTYYTGEYPDNQTPLTPVDLTEVKYIQFYLAIDPDPNQDPPATEVRSQVQLRNLKTNLGETSS